MKMIKGLLIMLFCTVIGMGMSPIYPLQDDCKQIDVKTEITNTSAGSSNGAVTIILVKGDRSSVKYIFCEENGKVLNTKQLKENSINGLKKGTYFCIVTTADCSKKISFTID